MHNTVHEIRLWALAIVLAAIGVFAISRGHLWKPVGEALIIAAALAVTVDRYIKLRLRDEIARDVFFAALGVHLPAELKEEMLAIGDYKLVRRNLRVLYRLSVNETPSLVNCQIETDFDMDNFTHRPQTFRHVLSVADAPAGASNVAVPILYVGGEPQPGVVAYAYTDKEIVPVVKIHSRDFEESVEIQAGTRGHFSSTTQHILPAEWEDYFILAQPTVGITVTVVAPPEISHHVLFDHRLGDNVRPQNGAWSIGEAFLPNTLFRVVWRRELPTMFTSAPETSAATPQDHPETVIDKTAG